MSVDGSRVVLKISGELLGGRASGETISHELLDSLCGEIIAIHRLGVELSIIIGGGNIFRGHAYNGRDSGFIRTDADKMGMLATAINGIALKSRLEFQGIHILIQSAFSIEGIAHRFSLQDSQRALEQRKIIIFCGGTGNPFFSTDSAAALRACELRADLLLKATNVDGVYNDDPRKNPNAKKFDRLSYREVLEQNLNVMDLTAFVLCMENKIPIRIFSGQGKGEFIKAIQDPSIGTWIGDEY